MCKKTRHYISYNPKLSKLSSKVWMNCLTFWSWKINVELTKLTKFLQRPNWILLFFNLFLLVILGPIASRNCKINYFAISFLNINYNQIWSLVFCYMFNLNTYFFIRNLFFCLSLNFRKAWFPLWTNMKQQEIIFETDFLFHVISQWKHP